jgi:hypothetical protein
MDQVMDQVMAVMAVKVLGSLYNAHFIKNNSHNIKHNTWGLVMERLLRGRVDLLSTIPLRLRRRQVFRGVLCFVYQVMGSMDTLHHNIQRLLVEGLLRGRVLGHVPLLRCRQINMVMVVWVMDQVMGSYDNTHNIQRLAVGRLLRGRMDMLEIPRTMGCALLFSCILLGSDD